MPTVMVEISLVLLPLVSSFLSILLKAYSLIVVQSIVFLLFFCSVLLVINRAKNIRSIDKLASLLMVIGFVIWYSFPAFYNCIILNLPAGVLVHGPLDLAITICGIFYLSLFLFSWVLASHFFEIVRFFHPMALKQSYESNPLRLLIIAIIGCLIGIMPIVFSGLNFSEIIFLIFQGRTVDKPWVRWENLGDIRSPYLFLAQSAMAAGACLLWILTRENKFSFQTRVLTGCLALTISLVLFFDQGTRSILALVFVPMVLMMVFEKPRTSNAIFLFGAIGFMVVFLIVMQFPLIFRTFGTMDSITSMQNLLSLNLISMGEISDMFSETIYSLTIVPAFHDYFRESVLFQFLVSPIPRFLWSSKPLSQVVWFYSLQRDGIDIYQGSGNVFPGIVGQYYMSWGGWGPILIGGVMGWLSSRIDGFLDRMRRYEDSYLRSIGMMMSVWIALSYRILSPGFLYPIIIAFLMVLLSRQSRYKNNIETA